MAGEVTIKFNSGQVSAVVGGASRAAVTRAAYVAQDRARGNIRAAGAIASGRMIKGIVVDPPRGTPLQPLQDVRSTAPWSKFQEDGTRAHGPVRAKVLRFRPKGSSSFVFAKRVRGVPAIRFMKRAHASLTIRDFLP